MRGSKYFVILFISLFISPMLVSNILAYDIGVIDKNLVPNRIETRTVTSSANTTFVSEYDHYYGYPDEFIVHNDLVYILDGNLGIAIYNLSTFQLELVKYIEKETLFDDFNVSITSSGYINFYKYDTTLIITMSSYGIFLFNTTNSHTLEPLCFIEGVYARAAIAKDEILYIQSEHENSQYKSIFYIFNITNSFSPLEIACFEFDNFYQEIFLQGDFIFFNNHNNGVTILDISVPSSPMSVANITADAYKLFVHNDCLVIANMYEDKLQFFNISIITNPIPTANISINVDWASFFSYFDNELLFIGGGSHVINTTNLYATSFQTSYGIVFQNLFTVEHFSWLGESKLMLRLVGNEMIITNYTSFTDFNVINYYLFHSYTNQIELVDNYAFISTRYQIDIISIEEHTAPELIFTYEPWGLIEDLVIYDDLLFISKLSNGLEIINISDCSNPRLIYRSYPNEWSVYTFEYDSENKIGYFGNRDSLTIINLINPKNPEVMATIDTNKVSQIILDNDYIYVCEVGTDWGLGNVNIYDVSVPWDPILVKSLNFGAWIEIYLYDHLLFISSERAYHIYDDNPLTILDTNNPESPQLVYYYNKNWFGALDFLVDNDILYACSTQNLILFDIQYLDSIHEINHTNNMVYPFPNSIAKRGDYLYVSKIWDGLGIYQIEFTYSEITVTITPTATPILNQNNLVPFILAFLTSLIRSSIRKNRKKK